MKGPGPIRVRAGGPRPVTRGLHILKPMLVQPAGGRCLFRVQEHLQLADFRHHPVAVSGQALTAAALFRRAGPRGRIHGTLPGQLAAQASPILQPHEAGKAVVNRAVAVVGKTRVRPYRPGLQLTVLAGAGMVDDRALPVKTGTLARAGQFRGSVWRRSKPAWQQAKQHDGRKADICALRIRCLHYLIKNHFNAPSIFHDR